MSQQKTEYERVKAELLELIKTAESIGQPDLANDYRASLKQLEELHKSS